LPATAAIDNETLDHLLSVVDDNAQCKGDSPNVKAPFGGGCVNQNNLHCWIDSSPFGGVGNSGMGKYYGKAGFDALGNTKAMLVGNPDFELDVFPPYAGKDIEKNLSVFSSGEACACIRRW
jgi:hypothetical protein